MCLSRCRGKRWEFGSFASIDRSYQAKKLSRMLGLMLGQNPVLDKANDAKHLTSQSICNGSTYSLFGPGPREH